MSRLGVIKRLGSAYLSYMRRVETVSHLPARVWLEPTPSCNFSCGYCPHGMEAPTPNGLMKMELFHKIISELEGSVNDVNLFHRGESLIHPRLPEMVETLTRKGIKSRLHTNAGLLTEDRARALIEAGLSYISFSVDGYTKEVYEKNRIGGDFDTTMANIHGLLELKKKLGKGPFTIVQVMELSEEAQGKEERLAAFRKNFEGLPLDRFVVRTPHNWAGDLSQFGEGLNAQPSARFTPCTFLWYSMTILYDGEVAACPQDFFCKIKVGNVAVDSVASVWNNEAMRGLRRRMRERNVNALSPCDTCDMLTRKTVLGAPVNYLSTFIRDNLLIK